MLAWYTLAGSIGTALGSLLTGLAIDHLFPARVAPVDRYRAIVLASGASRRG